MDILQNNIEDNGVDHQFSDCLSSLFDLRSLDLIINLLAQHFDQLKQKQQNTPDYLQKANLSRDLQLTESELIRFRMARPSEPKQVIHENNMSLDEFDL